MIAALDTLQTAKRLKAAGFDEAQAEALTGVLRDICQPCRDRLPTGTSFSQLEGSFDRFALEIRTECALFRAQIKIFRRDVTLQGGLMIAVATGVLLAAKFFG